MVFAHLFDAVVSGEAHDQLAFSQQIVSLCFRQVLRLGHRLQEKPAQVGHLRQHPPAKIPTDEHKQGQRILLQDGCRAVLHPPGDSVLGEEGELHGLVLPQDPKQAGPVLTGPIGAQGPGVVGVVLIPASIAPMEFILL